MFAENFCFRISAFFLNSKQIIGMEFLAGSAFDVTYNVTCNICFDRVFLFSIYIHNIVKQDTDTISNQRNYNK